MFGWFLQNPRVTAMARIIHEMSCFAHHMSETTGGPLHSYFLSHPLLKTHRAPNPADRDQIHFIWLSDGMQGFEVMVFDGRQDDPSWLSIAPDRDFQNARVQSGGKGKYMISINRSLSRPGGRLTDKLTKYFVSTYDAVDLGG
jgi:hypothetical protein